MLGMSNTNPRIIFNYFKLPLEKASEKTSESIHFQLKKTASFPRCPYDLNGVVQLLGPRLFVDLVCCVLSECRVLLHSNDMTLLPIICEGLLSVIYPLHWAHVYLPSSKK